MSAARSLYIPFALWLIASGISLYGHTQEAQSRSSKSASMGIMGDTADVKTTVKGGVALIGGGGAVNNAYKWMIERSGGGDVVVITASGNDGYGKDLFKLGGMNSVEILDITSRESADNDTVAGIIRKAEMLFLAGGDQSRYMRFWRGTKTLEAINYLLNVKKAPVGGTSAGCAVLGYLYYSGEKGSAVSAETLADPYNENVTIYRNDLLQPPFLQNVITDQHYLARKREGRHVGFLARIITDWAVLPKGIAADERTAVCIDDKGTAKVFGESKAYFIITDKNKKPELCEKGKPLSWYAKGKALKVYEIQGSDTGCGSFSLPDFNQASASGGNWFWWYVQNGELKKTQWQ